jgi:hypothetical protein
MLAGLPSDNLYKFICGLGIALIFASYVSGPLMLKTSVETYAIAVTDLSGKESVGPIQVNDSAVIARSRRSQLQVDAQFLVDNVVRPIKDNIEAQNALRYFILCLGFGMMVGGAIAWYRLTQRHADRASRNAGSTQMILDRKVELSVKLGPILTKIIDAYSPEYDDLADTYWPAEVLKGEVAELRKIRGTYGSVMKNDPIDKLERLIEYGAWALHYVVDSEHTYPNDVAAAKRLAYVRRAREAGLEELVKSLRYMVECEVRNFLP